MNKITEIFKLQSDEEIIIKIGEIIWERLEYDYKNICNLSEVNKTFVYIDILEAQVNNGGFDQFFFNSSGDYTYEILKVYENISAFKTAKIIFEAIQLFPELPVSKDTAKRRKQLENLNENRWGKWDHLDDKFYEYEEDIVKLLADYLKENKNQV